MNSNETNCEVSTSSGCIVRFTWSANTIVVQRNASKYLYTVSEYGNNRETLIDCVDKLFLQKLQDWYSGNNDSTNELNKERIGKESAGILCAIQSG